MSEQSHATVTVLNTEHSSATDLPTHNNHYFTQEKPDATMNPTDEENSFTIYRSFLLEYVREFLGTMIFCMIGNGANCQAALSNAPPLGIPAAIRTPAGDQTSLSLGWGAGIALGVWVSSGGHINPAVTLAFATWRKFPWKKVPFYILAQLLGATVGGAIVYGNYFHAISLVEGGSSVRTMKTAHLLGTFPLSFMTDVSAFFSEFLGSAMLLLGILTFTDQRNGIPRYLVPVALFITFYGIGASLGYETGFGLNPARDFGPRAVSALVGYGSQVFTARNHYWLWGPLIGCSLGAQVTIFFYDLLIYSGKDSLVYRVLGPRRRDDEEKSISSSYNTV